MGTVFFWGGGLLYLWYLCSRLSSSEFCPSLRGQSFTSRVPEVSSVRSVCIMTTSRIVAWSVGQLVWTFYPITVHMRANPWTRSLSPHPLPSNYPNLFLPPTVWNFPSGLHFWSTSSNTKMNYLIVCVQQPFPVLYSSICGASWEFQGSCYVKWCCMSNRESVWKLFSWRPLQVQNIHWAFSLWTFNVLSANGFI